MSYQNDLTQNNTDLQAILTMANAQLVVNSIYNKRNKKENRNKEVELNGKYINFSCV